MMVVVRRAWIAACSAVLLTGCGVVDTHLDSRIGSLNAETANARNEDVLINLVRAGRSEPMNFVAVSKASGTQTTDLKLGLPTITFGPAQIGSQRQTAFGSNSWENSAQSSFDSVPLETRDFYTNLLSDTGLQTMTVFSREGFPRELLFNIFIGSIRVESNQGSATELTNDPLGQPTSEECPVPEGYYGPSGAGAGDRADNSNPYDPKFVDVNGKARCRYRRFEYFLQQAMKWGLNIESRSVKNPEYNQAAVAKAKAAGTPAPLKTVSSTRLCFDIAFAIPNQVGYLRAKVPKNLCGSTSAVAAEDDTPDLSFVFSGLDVRGRPIDAESFTFTIRTRSPAGAFRYLGRAAEAARLEDEHVPGYAAPRLYWPESYPRSSYRSIIRVETRRAGMAADCFTKVSYSETLYCVRADDETSKSVLTLLAQLVAISTTSGSLPTTLDVRVQ